MPKVRLQVVVHEDGKDPRVVDISEETYFMTEIWAAVRNSKDPVDALCFLADEGAQVAHKRSPGVHLNRIGK